MARYSARDISIAVAVNEPDTYAQCVLASPDVANGTIKAHKYEGYLSSSLALDQAMQEATTPILLFIHQDVYLPLGFGEIYSAFLNELETMDPDWAIIGAIGQNRDGEVFGQVWSSGSNRLIGPPTTGIQEVVTVDECFLAIHSKDRELVDTELPHFHLYATDLVQSGLSNSRRSYVIPISLVHHSKPLVSLSGGYTIAYRYLRKKLFSRLPAKTMMGPVERIPLTLWKQQLRYWLANRGTTKRTAPTEDPRDIAYRLGYES